MKAIIPAAGYATRLYPLTKDTPKALLDIKGKPILEYIIGKILELNVDEIFIITNEKFYQHFVDWKNGFSCRIPIKILNDGTSSNETRLGQIGDIVFVLEKEKIDDDVMVIAGDNLFNFSLKPMYDFFRSRRSVVNALHKVESLEIARQLGTAKLGKNSKVIDFKEKDPNPDSMLASTGIYMLPKEQVKLFFEYLKEGNSPDKMGYFMIWLVKNSELLGFTYTEQCFDIGCFEALELTKREFKP